MQATLTVLFTDAVASTEALGRLGDERFGVVQQEHLDLLRGSVAACGGREVKSLGDGLMVAFTGAADALACAVAMQQAIEAARRGGEEGLPLRIGASSGDVSVVDDGDVTGTAVVEAARLCAAATRGQILVSELARGLAGSRGGHAFTPLGPVELKGLAEPVSLFEVGWAPRAEGGAALGASSRFSSRRRRRGKSRPSTPRPRSVATNTATTTVSTPMTRYAEGPSLLELVPATLPFVRKIARRAMPQTRATSRLPT